jgi:hypothetical protein
MARGCARARFTGKSLQIAVDGVPGTTETTQHLPAASTISDIGLMDRLRPWFHVKPFRHL